MKVPVLLAFTAFFSYIPTAVCQQLNDNSTPPDSIEKFEVITIKQNRLKEKLKESPLTVESMSAQSIKETPASDFYEALGHLKGVDITAASLGFRIVNTRGFNSTSPVRTLQIIDGVDNQSPGLNFSLGNFLGASELDIANQEIVVGASSAFYGPGAFNGVISMTTKDLWKTPGFSYKVKFGERNLIENAARYAHVFKNKENREYFALKANFYYMQAYDWVADNANPTPDSKGKINNPGGYDAVNRYGDEILRIGFFDKTAPTAMVDYPGVGVYYRQGYWEKDIVDYNTYNLKSSFTAAWKPKKNSSAELQYQVNFGMGTTVYQGDNRYSLNDIKFLQNRIEYKHKKGFLRVYSTHEDAGKTYDAVFTAMLMQGYAKKDDLYGIDYEAIWYDSFRPKIKKLPGYPTQPPYFYKDSALDYYARVEQTLAKYPDLLAEYHKRCRELSNRWQNFQNRPHNLPTNDFYEPGTERFDSMKNAVTSKKSFGEGGSGFYDKSALYHIQGERKFHYRNNNTFVSGFSGRVYTPNTQGTIFSDTNGRVIINYEGGAYGGWEHRRMQNKLKINMTARVDKNINFPFIFSPAASVVYTPNKVNYYRVSLTSGVRNPTLADQYLYYNVGRAILLGNINGYDSLVTIQSAYDVYQGSIQDLNKLKWFSVDPVRPERVKSIELGYKTFLFDNKVNVDASAYFSYYQDFIGYKIGLDPVILKTPPTITGGQVYRVATNATSTVTTAGASVGANYFIGKNYTVGGNYSWNQLRKQDSTDPIIPAFNTPEHKFNISVGGTGITLDPTFLNHLGANFYKGKWTGFAFNMNYKWVQGFNFEGSPQFSGYVPTYWVIDVMFAKEIPKWNGSFKIGASNVTNNMNLQVYGGPRIGRMAYISYTLDLK